MATALSAGPWLDDSEAKEGGGGSGQEWSSLDGEGRVVAGGVGRGGWL